jgi:hypothetical protein
VLIEPALELFPIQLGTEAMCTVLDGRCVVSPPSADRKVGGGHETRQVELVFCRSCFAREEESTLDDKILIRSTVCISTVSFPSMGSRPALRLTRSPIQWVPGILTL